MMPQTENRRTHDYNILITPLPGRVEARANGTLVASSTKAKVVYETRLKPVIYFPKEDIIASLIEAPETKTFCPFKGTAEYFHIHLPNGTHENAAWTYNNAHSESHDIEGYIAFMPHVVNEFDLGETALNSNFGGTIAGPTVDWILREAWLCKSPQELTKAIANKLLEDGIVVSRISVMIWSLHPLIAGKNYVWLKETNKVETYSPSYDVLQRPEFVNSPLRHVSNGFGGVRQRLTADKFEFDFPIMDDLKAEGATDYVAMPLPFSNGQINVMTLTCDHEKGFTTPNLGLVFEMSAVISRYYEVFSLQENSRALLETYLGKRTGERVLGGDIRRGDGDEIEAAILFCDLRDSTALEERLGRSDYIALLNTFFETITDIVNEHGGEVLKFIGDAVLAIFPAGQKPEAACQNACNAAVEIIENFRQPVDEKKQYSIECSMGMAFGDVMYGNIGSRERLDFTVIGSAANIAARLGDWGKSKNHPFVATHEILAHQKNAIPLGAINLRNVAEPVDAYSLQSE